MPPCSFPARRSGPLYFSAVVVQKSGLIIPFDELLADAPRLNSVRFRTAKTLSGREKAERDQIRHDTAIWLSDYCFLEKELKADRPYLLDQIADRDPISAAMAVRVAFSLNPVDPVYDISELMEKAGIKLRIRPFGFKKTFGLSIGEEDGGPGIVVNSEEGISVERQLFTIAHELGHLILHKASYKNSDEIENEAEEHEADVFAGTFLVPAEALEKEWNESKGLAFGDRVLKIKKIFKVSYKTLLIRLVQFDSSLSLSPLIIRFSQDYKAKYHHDLKDYYEPDSLTLDESNPVANHDPQELDISDLMEDRFSRLVRDAYEHEIISMSRAGEMLNLSITDMRTLIRAWQAL